MTMPNDCMPTLQIDYIPTDPVQKRDWIKYQLKIRGLSLAKLAEQHNVSRGTFSKALINGSVRWDRVIAQAIEFPLGMLWPERYSSDGMPLELGGVSNDY